MFMATKVLSRQAYFCRVLSRQTRVCGDKRFVGTSILFVAKKVCDKMMFYLYELFVTNLLLFDKYLT